jgi:LysR family transcriptional regulator (chromosome initiation inhibitor)
MFDAAHLMALRAAVDEGTFEAAARLLSITPSAVSQRIRALETEVGRVLLRRSKPIVPTESGRAVLRLARQLEAMSSDVARELGADTADADGRTPARASGIDDDEGRPPVRMPLAVNADSLATWLLPALAPLSSRIAFDFAREDESHTTELLRDGAVMAAVTAVAVPVQGCSSTLLGAMRYRPLAAESFARRWFGAEFVAPPTGDAAGIAPPAGAAGASALARSAGSESAFADAPVVVFDRRDELQHRFLRSLPGGDALDPPRHSVPSSADFVEAVRLGYGWGMIPDLQRPPDGLLELAPGAHIDVPLFWQQWQLRTRALDLTASAVHAGAAASLRPVAGVTR